MRRILFLLFTPALFAQVTTIEEILVVVNNHIITRKVFQQTVEQQYAELYRLFSGKELDEKLKDAREKTLEEMIDTYVLLDVALEKDVHNYVPSETEMLEDIKKSSSSTESELERMVRSELGMSLGDFIRQRREFQIVQSLLWQEVYRKVPVEDQEARIYYNEHQSDYKKPARLRIRELIISKGAASLEQASSRDVLAKVQEELKNGASFESLVRDFSTSPSKGTGGDLGWVEKGLLLSAIEESALRLQPEEVSDVIETDKDYILIQLIGSEVEGVMPFDAVKNEIVQKLQEPKAENARMHFIQAQRIRANIRYLVPKEQIIES